MPCRFVLPIIVVIGFVWQGSCAIAETLAWPQFRGPGGSGVADDQKPPIELGPETNVKWKIAAPSGLSSPIVVGNLLVITAFDEGKLYTVAYRRADGAEVWRAHASAEKIEPYFSTQGSPAASTCATDGERVVSYFGSCGIFCHDLAGKELWRYEMPTAATVCGFGTGNSPLLVDGLVILDREESTDPRIVALDAKTGKLKWEKKRESRSSFSTPAVWDTPAGKQIAVPGFKRMIGYDLKTGKQVWHVEGMPSASCTTPVTAKGRLYYAGWSPGDPNEGGNPFPSFNTVLKEGDTNEDGNISREESVTMSIKGFFEVQDSNEDGTLTREEWDAITKLALESRNSAFALRPGGEGDITDSAMAWKQTQGLPYVPSGIVYRGQYILVKDGGIVTSYDAATGKEVFRKRAAASGAYYASPVAANGNVYFTSLEDGAITVLEAKPSLLKTRVKNPPLGERTAATPAIADNTLYVRTAKHLYAFWSED
ncbi:MAG: PQQ-binding-like beta-propeller repeat protein [Pirellulales bacterium]|nr:PQQ-binding-like beta-propeller repeat protein [Pirellulales bacterium]